MAFEWTPEMTVDQGPVDEDHKELIRIANRLVEFDHPNREVEEIKQAIQALYEYAQYHFAREEGLMARLKYQEKAAHHKKHVQIIQEMNQRLTSAQHVGDVLGKFKGLVQTWVIDHIMEEDLKIHHFTQTRNSSRSTAAG